jgi:hypothetical protein
VPIAVGLGRAKRSGPTSPIYIRHDPDPVSRSQDGSSPTRSRHGSFTRSTRGHHREHGAPSPSGGARGTFDPRRTSWRGMVGVVPAGCLRRGSPSSAYPVSSDSRRTAPVQRSSPATMTRASRGSERNRGAGRWRLISETCRSRCDRKATRNNFAAKMYQLHTHEDKRGTLSSCAVSSRAVVGPVPHVSGRRGSIGESSRRGGPRTHFLDTKCTASKRSLFLEHRWGGCGL